MESKQIYHVIAEASGLYALQELDLHLEIPG